MLGRASLWGNEREPGMPWEVKGWRVRIRKEAGAVEKGDGRAD